MIKSNIVDISLFPKDSIAVVYEDKESKKRDVRFFKERVTQEEIDELQIWRPRPDDVTISVDIENELLQRLEEWAQKRNIDVEQILRGFLFYFVKYDTKSI